ncbi:MAG: hypothetical protein Q9M43_09050 [Sulfurimonas sp.]|nr:hypothetical protein [Sulfurimonas sp.]
MKKEETIFIIYGTRRKKKSVIRIYLKQKKEALDNIIVSQALLNPRGISYIKDSMGNFSKPYLFKKKHINRWQMSYGSVKKHKGKGYSDHLPVLAKFLVKD